MAETEEALSSLTKDRDCLKEQVHGWAELALSHLMEARAGVAPQPQAPLHLLSSKHISSCNSFSLKQSFERCDGMYPTTKTRLNKYINLTG